MAMNTHSQHRKLQNDSKHMRRAVRLLRSLARTKIPDRTYEIFAISLIETISGTSKARRRKPITKSHEKASNQRSRTRQVKSARREVTMEQRQAGYGEAAVCQASTAADLVSDDQQPAQSVLPRVDVSSVSNSPDVVGIFRFENLKNGEHREIALPLSRSRPDPFKNWYFVNCEVHSESGGKSFLPIAYRDSGGGKSLLGRKGAKKLGWSEPKPGMKGKKSPNPSLVTLGGVDIPCLDTIRIMLYFNDSMRWSWVEADVIEDEFLPKQYNLLLGQTICTDAKLLLNGPVAIGPSAYVQDLHSPYISEPLPMWSKPELLRVQSATPESAVPQSDA